MHAPPTDTRTHIRAYDSLLKLGFHNVHIMSHTAPNSTRDIGILVPGVNHRDRGNSSDSYFV